MHFLIFATTLLPLIVATDSVNFSTPYTSFPIGCHTFEGRVLCANGNAVSPGAKVILSEKDLLTADDDLATIEIQNAKFKIHNCAKDFPTPNLELFFKFVNVCQENSKKQSGILKENVLMEYIIHDDEEFAHTAINIENL